jgi:hypothetical protein
MYVFMYVCLFMYVCMNVCMYEGLSVCMHFFSLKMGPISCPEKSVNNHQHKLCYIPEQRRSQIQISYPVNFSLAVFEIIKQQDRQCANNVTLRRRRLIIITVDK